MKTVITIAALVIGAAAISSALVLYELGHFIDDVKGSD